MYYVAAFGTTTVQLIPDSIRSASALIEITLIIGTLDYMKHSGGLCFFSQGPFGLVWLLLTLLEPDHG
jgi:hypothetical protein